MNPQGTYDTWFECANEGYKVSGNIYKELDLNVETTQKLAIKFTFKELDRTYSLLALTT